MSPGNPKEKVAASRTGGAFDSIGIFVLAFATLQFELACYKVIHVQHFGNLGYVVIGTALLGFAASGVLMACEPRIRAIASEKLTPICSLLAGVTMLLSYGVSTVVPLDFTAAFERPVATLVELLLCYVAMTLPFFFGGLAIVSLLSRSERVVSWLYGADLVGAGLGAFFSIYVIASAGGAGALWIAGTAAILGGAVFAWRYSRRMALSFAGILVTATIAGFLIVPRTGIVVHTAKRGFVGDRDNGRILLTKWSTVSRIDVADWSGRADYDQRMLWFDAGSMQSHMIPPSSRRSAPMLADTSSGMVPYLLRPRKHALILASAGGKEVVWATTHGTEKVTAVELDPVVVDLVSGEYDQYLEGLFNRPDVELINSEGRSFVRRSREEYDVIQMVSAYSVTMLTSGAAADLDSYLVTKESIRDYYEHLTNDGVLYISRENGIKLFLTVVEALEDMGIDPVGHIYLEEGLETYNSNAIMVRKSPFPIDELEILASHAISTHRPIYFAPAELYELLGNDWTPESQPENTRKVIDTIYRLSGRERKAYVDSLSYSVEAPTDDKPFYNRTARYLSAIDLGDPNLPKEYRDFAKAAESQGPIPVGDVAPLAVLISAAVFAGLVIFWPLRRLGSAVGAKGTRWVWPTYFAMLGIGFIAIEVILLQRYVLFLGSPPLAIAVVLASLLIFAGLGSAFLSPRLAKSPKTAPIIFLLICGLVAVFALSLESIFAAALGFSLLTRCILGALLLAPLGLVLGVPFPVGLRLAYQQDERIVAWGWAMNGYATVVGTTATSIATPFIGYERMFLVGGGIYLLAGLCFLIILKSRGLQTAE